MERYQDLLRFRLYGRRRSVQYARGSGVQRRWATNRLSLVCNVHPPQLQCLQNLTASLLHVVTSDARSGKDTGAWRAKEPGVKGPGGRPIAKLPKDPNEVLDSEAMPAEAPVLQCWRAVHDRSAPGALPPLNGFSR